MDVEQGEGGGGTLAEAQTMASENKNIKTKPPSKESHQVFAV